MRVSTATFALALPLLAAANEVLPRDDGGQCNTGSQLCCNSTQQSTTTLANLLQGLLGIALPDITGLLGFNCSPLSAIGLGGNSCSAQPVCCTNNQFNGLVSLGCTPININL